MMAARKAVSRTISRISGSETLSANFSLLKKGYGTVVAQVTQPDGTPLAHVPVSLYVPAATLRSGMTDATGMFSFDSVFLGNYGVSAHNQTSRGRFDLPTAPAGAYRCQR